MTVAPLTKEIKDNWPLLLLITVLTGGSTGLGNLITQQDDGASGVKSDKDQAALVERMERIESVLDNVALETRATRLELQATKLGMGDRWTGTMEQAAWNRVRLTNPDFVTPDAKEIQRNYTLENQ